MIDERAEPLQGAKVKRAPFAKRNRPADGSVIDLLPLTPKFDESSHQIYLDAIEAALAGENHAAIKNIALTGSYGIGKSSILQEVAAKHKRSVVQVSLSTLGLTSDEESTGAKSITNRIQKEIVKQLLYRENPGRTPGSRFHRIGSFQVWRGIWIAILAALALTVVFFLAGWTASLLGPLQPHFDPGLWIHAVLFAAFSVFIFALEALSHNRLRIQSLQTGYATIALTNDTASYFDQYLDEIVYFFDVTRRDIVILEDIDRFEDPHIFETLRALNTLLNGARQLNGLNIRFIYAIKDSIFDELGNRSIVNLDTHLQDSVDAELARANRTKFFDLVIPVVPFITHKSARDLMKLTLSDVDHEISDELIDLASSHVADMRLIRNIRNEFVIFNDKILGTNDGTLALSHDSLFAMMLYKNTHLSDFELIRSGTSKLDQLYLDFRRVVNDSSARLRHESASISRKLKTYDAIAARSERFGKSLVSYLEQVGNGFASMNWNVRSASLGNRSWSAEDMHLSDFWHTVTAMDASSRLSTTMFDGQFGRQITFTLSQADITQVVGEPIQPAHWDEIDRAELIQQQGQIKEELEFLAHAELDEVIHRDEYTLTSGESLKQLTTKLDSKMAQQLVTEGYIDQYFTLYTSTYHSQRVSTQAQNFLIHHVDQNRMDAYFPLEPGDVEAVLRERSKAILAEPSMYNVAVLDYLLEADDDRIDRLVRSLASLGPTEQEFIGIYLTLGQQLHQLVRKLTPLSSQTLTYLMNNPDLESARGDLINEALSSLERDHDYEISDDFGVFIESNYQSLPILTKSPIDSDLGNQIAGTLARARVRLSALAPLGEEMRRAVVASNLYAITRENIQVALGGSEELALDRIRDSQPSVYEYLVDQLAEFLTMVKAEENQPILIQDPEDFEAVISDIAGAHSVLLPDIIARTPPSCRIEALADVPEPAWLALVEAQRVPATFDNVSTYIKSLGGLDSKLAKLLVSSGAIQDVENTSAEDKEQLAYTILQAREVIPDAPLRVRLVAALHLDGPLDSARIQPEEGPLIGLLVEAEVLEDDAASFALTRTLKWPSRAVAISKSAEFPAFMTPEEIPLADVGPLMQSRIVADSVKQAILNRIDEFVPSNDQSSLEAVARYAAKKELTLPVETVGRFSSAGVEAQVVIELLEPLLPTATVDALASVLHGLEEPYSTLAERNGKRPKVPLSDTTVALVERLKDLEVVSKFRSDGDFILVSMKKTPLID